MNGVTVRIRAKVNLSLNVTGIDGGYHALESVMASVSLFDTVTARKRTDGCVNVRFSGGRIENSNAEKAARLTCERYALGGVDIFIEQAIPVGGGVGGSSADAAGVIRALTELYGVNADDDELSAIAASVGSDVPFMLTGGYALVTGRGEKIKRINSKCELKLLLAWRGSVSTKECFMAFDNSGESGIAADNAALIKALELGRADDAADFFGNALEKGATMLEPNVRLVLDIMRENGLKAAMTGSGACVFGTGDDADMQKAADMLTSAGVETVFVKTEKCGYEIV